MLVNFVHLLKEPSFGFSDSFHYFFEISDIDNEDDKIFSIEIFNLESENLDRIYELIKNYINYLIDYNKNL